MSVCASLEGRSQLMRRHFFLTKLIIERKSLRCPTILISMNLYFSCMSSLDGTSNSMKNLFLKNDFYLFFIFCSHYFKGEKKSLTPSLDTPKI